MIVARNYIYRELVVVAFCCKDCYIKKNHIFAMVHNSELKIRISYDLKRKAKAAAKAKGTTVSKEIRKLLKTNLLNEAV